jgi:GNAT superfamily N-acetyltransferase
MYKAEMVDEIDRVFEAARCDHWWLPDHTRVVCRPEIEYLHSVRNRHTFNMVLRVDPELGDYVALVEEVAAAHRGRCSEWSLSAPSLSSSVEAAILGGGYSLAGIADAWSIDVDTARPPLPEDIRIERVEDLIRMRDMSAVMGACFGDGHVRGDAELEEDLSTSVGPDARCQRFVAYDAETGEALSAGAVNLFPDLKLAFMWGGCTIESARGRGIYSALVTARMGRARALGAERLGLYALRETSGPIIRAQGFTQHGPAHFWRLGPPD